MAAKEKRSYGQVGLNPNSLDRIISTIDITKAARRNASKRMEWHHFLSNLTVIVLSLSLIAMALKQVYLIAPANEARKRADFLSMMLSIATFAFSIVISMAGFTRRSEKFRECGLRLQEISFRMCRLKETASRPESEANLERVYANYLEILGDGYENHNWFDYRKASFEEGKALGFFRSGLVHLFHAIQYWPYALVIFLAVYMTFNSIF